MGKYVYLCFIKWTEKGLEKITDYWTMANELCKKHNIELLAKGAPFGTEDHSVAIYETDKPLAEFFDFRMKIASLNEERLVAYARTITVLKM